MRIATALLLVSGLLPLGSRPAAAQLALTPSGTPANMIVSTVVAGSQPAPITDATTSLDITAKCGGTCFNHVTAAIDLPMPPGTTLSIALGSPPAPATSAGTVILSTLPQSVVNGLKQVRITSLSITYVFTATVAAGVLPLQSRTVTFTLVSGP
jgi:hypothetical protein